MPTLYVENVPDEIYEALRSRAQRRKKSISAEVLSLLAENIPTAAEIARRQRLFDMARRIRARKPSRRGPFPSAEEMQREDRGR
jgi:plasmid stability protein